MKTTIPLIEKRTITKIYVIALFVVFFSCTSKDNEVINYYEDGSVFEKFVDQGEYLYFESYYETGELRSTGFVKEEQFEKEYIEYHKNGQVRIEANFKNGLRDGVVKWYHENGEKYQIIGYEAGEEKGILEIYNRQGKILYKGTKDSLSIGIQYQYFDNDNLSGTYEKVGNDTIRHILYYENGDIKEKKEY